LINFLLSGTIVIEDKNNKRSVLTLGEREMRVLIIEDDLKLSQTIEDMLKSASFVVDNCESATEGFEFARAYEYTLVILDLMLPDMDGYQWLKKLREEGITTPVLILSGLAQKDDIIKGLGIGADDYLTKPFDKRELLARIHALIRRSRGIADPVVKIGKLFLDLNARTVFANGEQLELTSKEYSLLEILFLRKGSILSKETFLNHLYGGMDEPQAKIIDVMICNLRKKISKYAGEDIYIETVWGRGYTIREKDEERVKLKSAAPDNNVLAFKKSQ
jgi:two-component system, cell cycle response regulator CtrA